MKTSQPRVEAAATRQNTATVEYEHAEYVRRLVASFPPLTAEQKERVAALLRPIIRSDPATRRITTT